MKIYLGYSYIPKIFPTLKFFLRIEKKSIAESNLLKECLNFS